MLHTINPEILFLKQEDVIKAGLLDMKQILAGTEKTYAMLGQGLIKNPPKTNTSIPDKENWQSFFNAMPCYIGGDINIGGIKWAAESKKNATIPGIPYGIDISILSDPETVLPFCILDGTLITAMRTSAVGGLMAKYAAPSNADTACLVGAGVIGRTMISAVHEALPQIKTMYLCDIDVAKAEGIAKEYGDSLGVEIIPTSDSKAAALKSQLIVGETTAPKPFMDTSWLTSGCGLVSMHSNEVMEDVFLKADGIVADYWTQLKQHTNPLSKLTKEGKLDESHEEAAHLGRSVRRRRVHGPRRAGHHDRLSALPERDGNGHRHQGEPLGQAPVGIRHAGGNKDERIQEICGAASGAYDDPVSCRLRQQERRQCAGQLGRQRIVR